VNQRQCQTGDKIERRSTTRTFLTTPKKLGPVEKLRACYEAGPTGYVSGYSYNCICQPVAETIVYARILGLCKTPGSCVAKRYGNHKNISDTFAQPC
jgi:hypothetical protein